MKKTCAIVIPSCEYYSDLWNGLSKGFEAYWPDCPFDKYLISNGKSVYGAQDKFKILPILNDYGWSSNLLIGVRQVPDDYILLWIDDLFLVRDVDNAKILNIFDFVSSEYLDYFRFNPLPPPPSINIIKYGFSIGILPKNDSYRTSTVCSLWRKEVLIDLLVDGESAWEFEYIGSNRSNKYTNFFAAVERNFYVKNTVVKGKWDPLALADAIRLGLVDGPNSRPVMTKLDFITQQIKNIRSHIFSCVPRGMRQKIRERLL